MKQNVSDPNTQIKLIRESMVIKDTAELLEIYVLRGTDEWTEQAYEVVKTILIERNVVFDENGRIISEETQEPEGLELEDDSEKIPPLDLSRINWQEDSVETVYFELCKRTLLLDDSNFVKENLKHSLQTIDKLFICVQCGQSVSWFEKTCPKCHVQLFPETGDQLQTAEYEQSELTIELASLQTDELLDVWSESDPMEWDREELADLRAAFAKHGFLPPYLLDAPADPVSHLPYLTIEELNLRGWPGYRNRPGRCGLDPLDRNAELGFMEGKMLRALFTLKLRTTNSFYLMLMLVFGTLYSFPLIALLAGEFIAWIFVPYIAVGFLLYLNVILSIWQKNPGTNYDDGENSFFPPE